MRIAILSSTRKQGVDFMADNYKDFSTMGFNGGTDKFGNTFVILCDDRKIRGGRYDQVVVVGEEVMKTEFYEHVTGFGLWYSCLPEEWRILWVY